VRFRGTMAVVTSKAARWLCLRLLVHVPLCAFSFSLLQLDLSCKGTEHLRQITGSSEFEENSNVQTLNCCSECV
jgi:hypothetical protein